MASCVLAAAKRAYIVVAMVYTECTSLVGFSSECGGRRRVGGRGEWGVGGVCVCVGMWCLFFRPEIQPI